MPSCPPGRYPGPPLGAATREAVRAGQRAVTGSRGYVITFRHADIPELLAPE